MIKNRLLKLILFTVIVSLPIFSFAKTGNEKIKNTQEVYQLSYIEREPGIDDYEITMLVSERYIRIDQPGEDNGFIVYDDKDKVIYSVSHQDKSVLVIKKHDFSEDKSPVKYQIEYLDRAPQKVHPTITYPDRAPKRAPTASLRRPPSHRT